MRRRLAVADQDPGTVFVDGWELLREAVDWFRRLPSSRLPLLAKTLNSVAKELLRGRVFHPFDSRGQERQLVLGRVTSVAIE